MTLLGMICDFLSRISFVDKAGEEESNEDRFSKNVIPCSTTRAQNYIISMLSVLEKPYLHSFIHVLDWVCGHVHELRVYIDGGGKAFRPLISPFYPKDAIKRHNFDPVC